jgi:hypothetical protein
VAAQSSRKDVAVDYPVAGAHTVPEPPGEGAAPVPGDRAAALTHTLAADSPPRDDSPEGGSPVLLRIELTERGCGLRVRGEIDFSNAAALRQALDQLPIEGPCHLYLDGLRFIDVTGTRELIRFARQTPDRSVVFHAPPAILRRIISNMCPEFEPHIEAH